MNTIWAALGLGFGAGWFAKNVWYWFDWKFVEPIKAKRLHQKAVREDRRYEAEVEERRVRRAARAKLPETS